ncbi:hypothetical protein P3W45_001630 [Vairimorpha bombi]|jgi:hypothetical protein
MSSAKNIVILVFMVGIIVVCLIAAWVSGWFNEKSTSTRSSDIVNQDSDVMKLSDETVEKLNLASAYEEMKKFDAEFDKPLFKKMVFGFSLVSKISEEDIKKIVVKEKEESTQKDIPPSTDKSNEKEDSDKSNEKEDSDKSNKKEDSDKSNKKEDSDKSNKKENIFFYVSKISAVKSSIEKFRKEFFESSDKLSSYINKESGLFDVSFPIKDNKKVIKTDDERLLYITKNKEVVKKLIEINDKALDEELKKGLTDAEYSVEGKEGVKVSVIEIVFSNFLKYINISQ